MSFPVINSSIVDGRYLNKHGNWSKEGKAMLKILRFNVRGIIDVLIKSTLEQRVSRQAEGYCS